MEQGLQPDKAATTRREFVLGMISAGALLALSGSERRAVVDQNLEDCGENPVFLGAEEVPLGEANNLSRLDWHVPGVSGGERLTVTPAGMDILDSKEEGYIPNPRYNTKQRLGVNGPFSLSAEVGLEPGAAFTLRAAGELPLVYDSFVFPRKGLAVTCSETEVKVEVWDGINQQPAVSRTVQLQDPSLSATIRLVDTGRGLEVHIGGQTLELDDEAGTFASGAVWLGMSATGGVCHVDNLRAQAVSADVTVADTRTLRVLPCVDGWRAAVVKTRPGFKIGTAVALHPLVSDAEYVSLVAGNFDLVTMENALKPQYVQPEEGMFTFDEPDQIMAFARRHGIDVHGHTLVFARSLPRWMKELPTDTPAQKERVRQVMVDHIQGVLRHYPDIRAFDVVNEPLDGLEWRRHLWFRAMGEGYIEEAFRAAHEVRPDLQLWINDYSMDKDNNYDEARFQIERRKAVELNNKGILVHGISFQGHVYKLPRDAMSPKALARRFMDCARDDLWVRVSEMDVTAERGLSAQAKQFGEIAKVCVEAPNCTGYAIWGIGSKYASTAGVSKSGKLVFSSNLPWDERLRPRPAYAAIRTVLEG